MRIVIWNVNMALHSKFDLIAELKPDLAVLAEVARPDVCARKGRPELLDRMVWIGSNDQKGLGVVGFGSTTVSLSAEYDARIEFVAPIEVTGLGAIPRLHLLAIWAANRRARQKHPREPERFQTQQALLVYDEWLRACSSIVAGDLNHSVVFDKPGRPSNHDRAVAMLDQRELVSAYHEHHNAAQGKEPDATLYWRDRKREGRTYHVDYCFFPRAWRPALLSAQFGTFDDWIGSKRSDHVPLIVDFADELLPIP